MRKKKTTSRSTSRHEIRVSLITTERNEEADIGTFIESAMQQSLPPDEIVIADGGSTDGTVEIIQAYIDKGVPIKLVHAPGNRSVGRNAATAAASYEYIACSDVGSRLDKDWLKNITQPFRESSDAMVVSGGFRADPQTYFEKVSSTLMLDPNEKIEVDTWLPSSRSIAYTKTAWEKAGKYPEYTNFNEDTPFDLALKSAGFRFYDGLKAIVYWRPRPTLREFYRQYYWYAVGDGIDAIELRHFQMLYVKYIGVLLCVLGAAFFSVWLSLVIFLIVVAYTARRAYRPWRKLGGINTLILMIILLLTFDLSQMVGYAKGYLNSAKLKTSKKLVR